MSWLGTLDNVVRAMKVVMLDSTTERVSDEWRENTLAIIPFVVAGVDQFKDWFKDANTGLIIFCSFACIAHQVKVKM